MHLAFVSLNFLLNYFHLTLLLEIIAPRIKVLNENKHFSECKKIYSKEMHKFDSQMKYMLYVLPLTNQTIDVLS